MLYQDMTEGHLGDALESVPGDADQWDPGVSGQQWHLFGSLHFD